MAHGLAGCVYACVVKNTLTLSPNAPHIAEIVHPNGAQLCLLHSSKCLLYTTHYSCMFGLFGRSFQILLGNPPSSQQSNLPAVKSIQSKYNYTPDWGIICEKHGGRVAFTAWNGGHFYTNTCWASFAPSNILPLPLIFKLKKVYSTCIYLFTYLLKDCCS